MKKIFAIWVLLFVFMSGCSGPKETLLWELDGQHYSNAASIAVAKKGEKTNLAILGFIGQSYPSVVEVAQENNITKIAIVEHYYSVAPLFIFITRTTVVAGE